MHRIDIETLREVLKGAENMVAFYSDADEKRRANDALVAAGLGPIHSEFSIEWGLQQRARHQRHVECLKSVIAMVEAMQAEAA
jgi:hypothetical protein